VQRVVECRLVQFPDECGIGSAGFNAQVHESLPPDSAQASRNNYFVTVANHPASLRN
jgi:hypothetical protein